MSERTYAQDHFLASRGRSPIPRGRPEPPERRRAAARLASALRRKDYRGLGGNHREAVPASWTVEGGSLKALVRTDGAQDIRTTETFRSFDLQFDWKILSRGNSGVKYRIQNVDEWTNPAGRQARARGLEYQIADDADPDAASDPRKVAASLYSLIAPVPRVRPRIGDFNHSRLLVRGTHVEHWLNGVNVLIFELTDPSVEALLRSQLPKGSPADAPLVQSSPISLQNHSSEAWFRNIKIRVLPD